MKHRVLLGAVVLGIAMTAAGCLTTALVGLCVSGCGAGCVGALGTCMPIGDETAPPRPVEVAPPRAAPSAEVH